MDFEVDCHSFPRLVEASIQAHSFKTAHHIPEGTDPFPEGAPERPDLRSSVAFSSSAEFSSVQAALLWARVVSVSSTVHAIGVV